MREEVSTVASPLSPGTSECWKQTEFGEGFSFGARLGELTSHDELTRDTMIRE